MALQQPSSTCPSQSSSIPLQTSVPGWTSCAQFETPFLHSWVPKEHAPF